MLPSWLGDWGGALRSALRDTRTYNGWNMGSSAQSLIFEMDNAPVVSFAGFGEAVAGVVNASIGLQSHVQCRHNGTSDGARLPINDYRHNHQQPLPYTHGPERLDTWDILASRVTIRLGAPQ